MRVETYKLKIFSASMIVENLKEDVLKIFWEEDPYEYCSSRSILPWIQEEAEYSIRELHLKQKDQSFYIQKINDTLGEYSED